MASDYAVSGLKENDFSGQDTKREFYMPVGAIVCAPWGPNTTDTTTTSLSPTITYAPASSATSSLAKIKSIVCGQKRQPIGTIICSILPLGNNEMDTFSYNGYLLFPLGD